MCPRCLLQACEPHQAGHRPCRDSFRYLRLTVPTTVVTSTVIGRDVPAAGETRITQGKTHQSVLRIVTDVTAGPLEHGGCGEIV